MAVAGFTPALLCLDLWPSSALCDGLFASSRKEVSLIRSGSVSGSDFCRWTLASGRRVIVLASEGPLSGRRSDQKRLVPPVERVITGYLLGYSNLQRVSKQFLLCSASKCLSGLFVTTSCSLLAGKRGTLEKIWHEFFSDPTQWWDHRAGKLNSRYPDFKHKKTQKSLWLDGRLNPPWVEAELAKIVPGTVQLDLFTWNTRLARYVEIGHYEKTLKVFQQMQKEGMEPNSRSFVAVLNACSSLRDLDEGRRIHTQIVESGYGSDLYVCNSLIDMYGKCGSIDDAWRVFNKMPIHDVVSWSAIIRGHVKYGEGKKALELFQEMSVEGIQPNSVTFIAVLNACASVNALEEGKRVHQQIIEHKCEIDIFVGTSLVDMYGKCGSIEDACRVFNKMPTRNVISWNAMILGHVKCGQGQRALELSRQMLAERVEPNPGTFVALLNACASISAIEEGRFVHQHIIQKGLETHVNVGSGLIDMYAKCECILDAWDVFNKMPMHDVVSWSAMILGYVRSGQAKKALELFWQMQLERVEPNCITFIGVVNACANLLALEEGRSIHKQIIEKGHDSDVFVGNCLINMYSRCGSIEEAETVFNRMCLRDVVSWNAMMEAYAIQGYAKEALGHFEQMCQECLEMDGLTFLSLLSACSHGGLVDEGLHYFESMRTVYSISPTVEHYACMVDLLGRAGRLREAEDLIKIVSCETHVSVWVCLLGACRVHRNVEIGERVAKRVLELETASAGD